MERIAAKTHPVGSSEQKDVRDYLITAIAEMGFQPVLHEGFGENDAESILGFVPYAGELENIYFRLEGAGNTNHDILMLAHYDSTLGGPGAADDASGVAALLETARALKAQAPLLNDIVFLFTDGEEAELLGSKLFAEQEGIMKNVNLVMNFESRGRTGPSILFETSDQNGWLMKEFSKVAPYPVAYSFSSDVYKMVSNVTDFTPFKMAGKRGFNFSNLGGMEIYHNTQDTPENLDQGFLQHQGLYALSLAKHFGNIPLDGGQNSDDAVFFTLARSVMALYSVQWNIPLTAFLLMLLAAALILVFRKHLVTAKGVIKGFLASLFSIIVAAVFGIAVQLLFTGIYFQLDKVHSISELVDFRRMLIFQGNIWIVVSLVLSFALIFLMQRLFIKKATGIHLLLGNLVVWSILAVMSAFALPGAAYMFQWPVMLTLAGLLADIFLCRAAAPKYRATFVLSTLACMLIFLPVGYLLYQSLTMLAGGVPIALLSIPASLMMITVSIYAGKTSSLSAMVFNTKTSKKQAI